MNRLLHTAVILLAFTVLGKTESFVFPPLMSPTATLMDTVPPVIFCPPSQIINLAPMRCDTVLFYTVEAFDNQGQVIVIMLDGIASGGTFPAGATVSTFLATDLAGNTATCSFTITAQEPTPQPLCRPQTTVYLSANCTKTTKAFDILTGGPYGCASHYTAEVDKTAPLGDGPWLNANFNASDINMTYQVRVSSLFTGTTCTGTIIVKDSLPPVITVQDINVPCALPLHQLTPLFLADSFGLAAANPTAVDGCSGPMLSISFVDVQQNLPCDDTTTISGIINRIWTATDPFGNVSTKTQVIRRNRLLSDVQIPAPSTVNCNNLDLSSATNGRPFIEFQGREYELTPASYCEFDAQSFDTILPGACAGSYTVLRTWKIYDACLPFSSSNPKIGVQNIDVEDTSPPSLQCPGNIIISSMDNNCRATVNLPDIFLSDNCSALTSFQVFWSDNGMSQTLIGAIAYNIDSTGIDTLGVMGEVSDFPIGTTPMLYTVEDECGNMGECSFNLIVANVNPPVVACDTFLLTGLPASGYLDFPAMVLDNGSTDDCSPLVFKAKLNTPNACHPESMFSDTVYVCCNNLGDTLEGVLRVYDISAPLGAVAGDYGSGHYSDCNFKIRVTGSNPPKCTAPADITISCEAFDPTLESFGGLLSQTCSVDSVVATVNYSQFDTICSRGTLVRNFKVFDQNGIMGSCSQKIVAEYEQNYYIRFPNDMVVSLCDTSGFYGEPTFFGQDCELMNASFQDVRDFSINNGCFKIERTWAIINWCTYDPNLSRINVPNPNPIAVPTHPDNLPGPIVSPIQAPGAPWRATLSKVNASDPTATDYSTFFDLDANGYNYTQIIYVMDSENPVVETCPSDTLMFQDNTNNDPSLWNASYWFDPMHLTFDLCEAPIVIGLTATDACAENLVTIKFQLFLDLDSDGVRETTISSNNLPPSNTVFFNNSAGPGEARQFDFRSVPADQKYRFAKEEVISGNKKTAYVRFNTTGTPNGFLPIQLPYGNHKIKWTITDQCSNETVCERTFIVRDGKAPTVICKAGLFTSILPTKEVSINATELLQYHEDNCTPSQFLVLGIRKAGTGMGFPLNANGNPVTKVTFDCDELGAQMVELWSRDRSGNAGFCQTSILIQDNSMNCVADPGPAVGGRVTTDMDEGLENVLIRADAPNTSLPAAFYQTNKRYTDSLGFYNFGVQYNSNPINSLNFKASYNENPLNGVTTYDLVLLSKHILGIEALGSPYKLIAADANKSGSITTFDIVELRKLILGIYQKLPNNTSWRFVDKAYVFPNMQNPFQPPFPDTILYTADGHDFIGIKIGDVNNTVVVNANQPALDRTAGTLFFKVSTNDREQIEVGEVIELRFKAPEDLVGCQFTLELNNLELLDLLPGQDLTQDNFAYFPEKKALTMAWEQGGSADFSLKCKALVPANIREILSISSSITKAEAYKGEAQVERYDLGLQFQELGTFELFQNQPNPFDGATEIVFNLPEASEATLKVFDTNGRILFTQTGNYGHGMSSIRLEKSSLDGQGLLYYQLETSRYTAVKKMVKLKDN